LSYIDACDITIYGSRANDGAGVSRNRKEQLAVKFYECLDVVYKHNPHYMIEVDGREHDIAAFARHADMNLLQAEAQLIWQHVTHPVPDQQVGLIEVEPVRHAGQILAHHKRIVLIRYRPRQE
jgi:hypothetical protein